MFATFPNTCVIISITKVLLSLVFLYIHSQIGHHIPISLKGLCTLIVRVVYGVFNIGRIEIYRRICRNCNALCQLFSVPGFTVAVTVTAALTLPLSKKPSIALIHEGTGSSYLYVSVNSHSVFPSFSIYDEDSENSRLSASKTAVYFNVPPVYSTCGSRIL